MKTNLLLLGYGFGVRHIQIGCMCLTMVALFIARSSLGVAILAMTDMGRKNDTSVPVRLKIGVAGTQTPLEPQN